MAENIHENDSDCSVDVQDEVRLLGRCDFLHFQSEIQQRRLLFEFFPVQGESLQDLDTLVRIVDLKFWGISIDSGP